MKRAIIISVVILLAAAGALTWRLMPQRVTVYTDADQIREPIASASVRDILWQPPARLPEIINSATADDYEPKLSADGLTLFFVRGKAGGHADIYTCRKTPQGWSPPEALAAVNSSADELGPEPSADGRSLYFYSDRPGGSGGYDLWVSRRGAEAWQAPTNLGPRVNSPYNDYGPALTPDGTTLYFASNRPTPQDEKQPDPAAWSATLREDIYHRKYDLYASAVSDAGIGAPEPQGVLNTTDYNEGAPAVSPFGDFLYFCSDRPGGQGGFDLYRARRIRGGLLPPENLGPSINTADNELDPGLGMGGFAMFFSSDRPTGEVRPAGGREYAVYHTTSREVFRDTEEHRTPINWAGIWSAIAPNLMWALLSLLLLLLLLALMRDSKDRKLSLLTKCLLASLAAHLILLLLLNFWQVGTTLALALHSGGKIQVALTESARADDLALQIRGSLTDVASPAPQQVSVDRPSPAAVDVPQATLASLETDRTQVRTADAKIQVRPVDAPPRPAEARPEPPDAKALARVELDSTLNLRLPSEAAPTPHEERPAPEPAPRVADAAAVERATIAAAASQPVVPAAPVALTPESPRSETEPADHPSLAAAPAAQDAPRQNALALAPAMPTLDVARDAAPTLSLTLPPVEHGRAERVAESAAAPSAVQAESPRLMNTTVVPASAGSGFVRVAPQPSPNQPHDDAPMVTSSPVAIAEAATPTAAPPAGLRRAMQADQDLPPAPTPQIGVPAAPATPRVAAATPEPGQPRVTAAQPESARASLAGSGLRPPAPQATSVVRIDPTAAGTGIPDTASLLDLTTTPQDGGRPAPAATPPRISNDAENPAPLKLALGLPKEEAAPGNRYAQRDPEQRLPLVERMGGSQKTEDAVALALQWLAAHQSRDGRWSASEFDAGCGQCGGTSDIQADAALTGLSLLCFLAADHTHKKDGPYREHVRKGLKWLRDHQKDDGDLRAEETMYSHGIAALAMSEAFGMTHDPRLSEPVQRAADFIGAARAPNGGGWRYEPGQPGDTSVLGWQVMALRSAQLAGADVPTEVFDGARAWLARVADSSRPGRYGYQPGRNFTSAMTAEGLFVRELLGAPHDDEQARGSVNYLLSHLPDWETDPNTYYWYYATLALYHHQGDAWPKWNEAVTRELLAHQRKSGRPAGSWDPAGEWATTGGRVYQTAICALTLEVYYRYLPLNLIPDRAPAGSPQRLARGTLRGTVTNVTNGQPLRSAVVRLDLPGKPLTVRTDSVGKYLLTIPNLPAHVAISATHAGFIPQSVNLPTRGHRGLTRDFALQPLTQRVVAIEAAPDVHHLGNDRFDGPINSQFQRHSEGTTFEATFEVTASQLSGVQTAEIHLLTKGVQCPHKLYMNGELLPVRLRRSPADGSFGASELPFPAEFLHEGENTLRLTTSSCEGDIDDFEFVNVQIHLVPARDNSPDVTITPRE